MKRREQPLPSFEQLLQKLKKYCAWRERCKHEASLKLQQLNANGEQTKQVLKHLAEEGFLDNQRFARMFTQGKLHNNKWGKQRIRMELLQRNIQEADIRQALESINEDEYIRVLKQIIHTKQLELIHKKDPHVKEKTARYGIQKGFEPALVWKEVEEATAGRREDKW
jgi:regulatory protein